MSALVSPAQGVELEPGRPVLNLLSYPKPVLAEAETIKVGDVLDIYTLMRGVQDKRGRWHLRPKLCGLDDDAPAGPSPVHLETVVLAKDDTSRALGGLVINRVNGLTADGKMRTYFGSFLHASFGELGIEPITGNTWSTDTMTVATGQRLDVDEDMSPLGLIELYGFDALPKEEQRAGSFRLAHAHAMRNENPLLALADISADASIPRILS